MGHDSYENFKELLDSKHRWPSEYQFKFIVRADLINELKDLFVDQELILKKSSNAKYYSVTIFIKVKSSDEVISIYKKASTIPGIISL
jgi:putative lipoic acid-binding regulatory protein